MTKDDKAYYLDQLGEIMSPYHRALAFGEARIDELLQIDALMQLIDQAYTQGELDALRRIRENRKTGKI